MVSSKFILEMLGIYVSIREEKSYKCLPVHLFTDASILTHEFFGVTDHTILTIDLSPGDR